jgi:uncharacterized protein (TIGR02996 family)
MTQTTGDHLLAEIVKPENRAEDTLRLIYADWLEENDQPERAEFIRVQVELASLLFSSASQRPGKIVRNVLIDEGVMKKCLESDAPRIEALGRREQELFDAGEGDWFPDIDYVNLRRDTSRGFVSSLTLSWEDWLEKADGLLAAHPIEKIVLTTRPPDDHFHQFSGQYVAPDAILRNCLAATWPHIEFELPTLQTFGPFTVMNPTNPDNVFYSLREATRQAELLPPVDHSVMNVPPIT